ncbi:hypothetical protein KQX54_011927 [Cotesia glomerata]|uniref:Uncharacterized protein n=1 Tax=Cotesia glomerata TaxID=32391 RepID=A0AAV7IR58_COTGL|nr:hypothetical protein KQX54_011927 [Cotesia glomerata]
MKWHIIAAVLLTAAFIPKEILAKPSKARYRSKGISKSSKLKNNPANRRPTSTSVTSYNPRTSIFRPIPSAGPSLPPPPPPSPSSHFGRLRLSSGSQPTRSRTPSPQSSSPSKSTASGGSRNTYRYQNPYVPTATNPLLAVQPGIAHLPITSGTASGVSLVTRRRHVKARTSLQQLGTISRNSRSQTRSINPPPLVRSPSQNPPPLPSLRFPSPPPVYNPPAKPPPASATNPPAQVGNPVSGTSGSQPPPQVGNPVPGPSGSQPPAPAALVQVGAASAPGSRAAAKAAKAQAKQNKINKIKTNAQAALQQVNANIGTCKDVNAPPEACFDFFVLSISWGPATKIKRLGTAAPINKPKWSVHGLWPSLKTYMKHPKQCNLKIPYDPNQVLPIQNELEDKWFSANGSPMTHQALWRHEWEKHGTCAARSPQIKSVKQYFKKGLELFNQANVQAKLTAANFRPKKELTNKDMHDEISRILGHRVTLEFIDHPRTSELWLSGIRLCYDFNFLLIDCPPATKTLNTVNENTKMIYSL